MITVVLNEKMAAAQTTEGLPDRESLIAMASLSRMFRIFNYSKLDNEELISRYNEWDIFYRGGGKQELEDRKFTYETLIQNYQFPTPKRPLRQFSSMELVKMRCQLGMMASNWVACGRDFRDLLEIVYRVTSFHFTAPHEGLPIYHGVHFVTGQTKLAVAAAVINDRYRIWLVHEPLVVGEKGLSNVLQGEDIETGKKWIFKYARPSKSTDCEVRILETAYRMIVEQSKKEGVAARFPFPMQEIISVENDIQFEKARKSERILVQEYYEKGDLYSYITQHRLSLFAKIYLCKEIFYHIWEPLAKLGIYHRDIKLDNIICLFEGTSVLPKCRVIDWGASQIRGEDPSKAKMTLDIAALAISAEEYQDYVNFKINQDWKSWWELCPKHEAFSFGNLFYQLLVRRLPYAVLERTIKFDNGNEEYEFPYFEDGIDEEALAESLGSYVAKWELINLIKGLLDPDRNRRHTFEQAKRVFDALP